MKMIFVPLLVLSLGHRLAEGAHWALLVAGSRGYVNYRHQADVCHAYQLLQKLGLPEDNIVTMMYDDIAHHRKNPFQGNIINVPNGPNVYEGVRIDYRGKDVTPHNFLQALQGKPTHGGNGRVVNTTADDHVFVYFSDHGSVDLIGFPGDILIARQLKEALENMFSKKQYKKMVFYIEACYSGSMFEKHLPRDRNIYALTAANTEESSYSAYYDRYRKIYLADEFSANWMCDTESHDVGLENLHEQFVNVKKNTRYSHVCAYGDIEGMGDMKIKDFQAGTQHTAYSMAGGASLPPMDDAIPSHDVPFMTLYQQLRHANSTNERLEILFDMEAELRTQVAIRGRLEDIVGKLTSEPLQLLFQVKEYTYEGTEDDGCYELAVQSYLKACRGFEEFDYRFKDLHVFNNLCNEGRSVENINQVIEEVCSWN